MLPSLLIFALVYVLVSARRLGSSVLFGTEPPSGRERDPWPDPFHAGLPRRPGWGAEDRAAAMRLRPGATDVMRPVSFRRC